ncbi:MAG: methyl-accepting chemotaxis protein [Pseudomonadota bacterium]
MKFLEMRVGVKLACGFGLVMLLLVVETVLGVSRLAEMQDRIEAITSINGAKANLGRSMRDSVSARMISLRDMALIRSLSAIKEQQQLMKRDAETYAGADKKLAAMLAGANADPKEVALVKRIRDLNQSALPVIDRAASNAEMGQSDLVYEVFVNELLPVQAKWMAALNELIAAQEKLNASAALQARASYEDARNVLLALGTVALLISVAAAYVITRGLLRQLGGEPSHAVAIAGQIAAGDLRGEIALKDGDTESLMCAMKSMRDSLADIVTRVRAGTDTIGSVSNSIADGNADLFTRTQEQSVALERSAASMEELTATVKRNTDNALLADQLAGSSAQVAVEGGSIVSDVVATMTSIHQSSRKIADITSVIDGISFQTNILALNAAVEAARAGEQGRGFAVVAAEVRILAQRSAAAAKEINVLTADSLAKVEDGSRLAGRAGKAMEGIVDSVQRVNSIISEMADAGVQQSVGIEHASADIVRMDGMTQQNAALVEEAAAAAESMREQAMELLQVVGTFKLGSTGSDTAAGKGALAVKANGKPGARRALSAPAAGGMAYAATAEH